MLKKVGQVNINREELRDWCRDRINDMIPDISNYAKGRYRLWLFHECNLKTGEVTKAYYDDRIWQFSQKVYSSSNIGLLTFGGESKNISSSGLIKPHRDHTFAKSIARSVNLGSCLFGYGNENHELYQLNDGDITEFNCKILHSVAKILSTERFSITFWQLNTDKGYHSLM